MDSRNLLRQDEIYTVSFSYRLAGPILSHSRFGFRVGGIFGSLGSIFTSRGVLTGRPSGWTSRYSPDFLGVSPGFWRIGIIASLFWVTTVCHVATGAQPRGGPAMSEHARTGRAELTELRRAYADAHATDPFDMTFETGQERRASGRRFASLVHHGRAMIPAYADEAS